MVGKPHSPLERVTRVVSYNVELKTVREYEADKNDHILRKGVIVKYLLSSKIGRAKKREREGAGSVMRCVKAGRSPYEVFFIFIVGRP